MRLQFFQNILTILLLLNCSSSFGQSQILIEKSKSGKSDSLEIDRIIGISTSEFSLIGNVESWNEREIKFRAKSNKRDSVRDSIFTFTKSDITEVFYCKRKNESRCAKRGILILPISAGTGLIAGLTIMLIQSSPYALIPPILGAFVISPIIYGSMYKRYSMNKWSLM